MIRTLIIDDVQLARERLKRCLAAEPDVEIVGECDNGTKAVESIRALSPDLIFLDVQMPALDGLACWTRSRVSTRPRSSSSLLTTNMRSRLST